MGTPKTFAEMLPLLPGLSFLLLVGEYYCEGDGRPRGILLTRSCIEIILKRENCAERPLNIMLVVALNPQPLAMLVYYCICEPKYVNFCNKQSGKTKFEFILLLPLQSCWLTAPFVGISICLWESTYEVILAESGYLYIPLLPLLLFFW